MKQKLLLVLALLGLAVTGIWAQSVENESLDLTYSNFDDPSLTCQGTYFDVELLVGDIDGTTIDQDGMTAPNGMKIKGKGGNKIYDVVLVSTYNPGYVNMDDLSTTAGTLSIKRESGKTTVYIMGVGGADEVTFVDLSSKPHFKEAQINYFVPINTRDDLEGLVTNYSAMDKGVYHTRQFKENVGATLCLPFGVESFTSGTIYEFGDINYDDVLDEWVATMNEVAQSGTLISTPLTTAGVPYLFMPSKTASVTFVGRVDGVPDDVAVFDGDISSQVSTDYDWKMTGTYKRINWAPADDVLFGFVSAYKDGVEVDFSAETVEAGQFVKTAAGAYFPAFRAFLEYGDFAPSRALKGQKNSTPSRVIVRLVNKSDSELDGVKTVTATVANDDSWYDLQGRRYNVKPAKAGIYVKNGSKMIVK